MNNRQLFKERLQSHLNETIRYLKYIVNGHTAIALIFLVGAGAFYYQQLLANLPNNFPTALITAICMTLVTVSNPIQNLLKEADLVFLLPAERRLTSYFNYTLIYSFVTQLYLVMLVLAALAPLVQTSYPNQSYTLLIFLVFFFKLWHFSTSWWLFRLRYQFQRLFINSIRLIVQFVIFYSVIVNERTIMIIATILLFGLFLVVYFISHQQAFAWDQLIEKDRQRLQSFYRLASMFTDVPHFKPAAKKRRLLVNWFTRSIGFTQSQSYDYLYRITLIRSGDYLGIYIRLVAIASLALAYMNHFIFILVIPIIFMYLSGVQLLSLWYHHRLNLWQRLYPIAEQQREKALVKLIERLLVIQLAAYLIVFVALREWTELLSVMLVGITFIYGFCRFYIPNKLGNK
ncbi:ABC transporter permease [Amphibacillus sediminis]|uniref:ABC transporter permease n=1 Tax=Amphibacillus sediminis TaxID=360185 RepID=UPI0008376159|nr:ABC transporter permease [Amphibacillus sediminis]